MKKIFPVVGLAVIFISLNAGAKEAKSGNYQVCSKDGSCVTGKILANEVINEDVEGPYLSVGPTKYYIKNDDAGVKAVCQAFDLKSWAFAPEAGGYAVSDLRVQQLVEWQGGKFIIRDAEKSEHVIADIFCNGLTDISHGGGCSEGCGGDNAHGGDQ